jgi:hypothetical protein
MENSPSLKRVIIIPEKNIRLAAGQICAYLWIINTKTGL